MRLATTTLTAVATATALAATSTLSPVATAEETAPVPVVESGYVSWSIKDSFLRYLQGPIAKGSVTASEGLETIKNDKDKITNFKFPVDAKKTSINADGVGTIDLDGAIHFLGHKGYGNKDAYGLDVTLSDFKVKLTEKEAVITVDYLSKGWNPGENKPFEDQKGDDVEFAKLPLTAPIKPAVNQTVTSESGNGSLAKGGVEAMMGFYEEGIEMAPASFNVKFGEPVKPKDPAGSSLSTGGIIGIIIALLALIGGGAFFAQQAGFLK